MEPESEPGVSAPKSSDYDPGSIQVLEGLEACLLYTSDAADE